jgi:hypothetical protein
MQLETATHTTQHTYTQCSRRDDTVLSTQLWAGAPQCECPPNAALTVHTTSSNTLD